MERPASGRIWCALSRVGMFLCVTAMCLSVCSASFASEGEPGEYMESVPRGKNGLTYKLAVRRWSTSKKPAHATVILQVMTPSEHVPATPIRMSFFPSK
jgi:hypothetical protein